jgi:hypothetical protein
VFLRRSQNVLPPNFSVKLLIYQRLGAQIWMQTLELISFSGNPYLVCNLLCLWRFSSIFRRVSLACYTFVFWRLRASKKANFGCGQNLPFCQTKNDTFSIAGVVRARPLHNLQRTVAKFSLL